MQTSKYNKERVAFALRQAKTVTRVEESCRKLGISQATFYAWKRKYVGLGVSELRRLQQLEAEKAA
jgi:putative transposase